MNGKWPALVLILGALGAGGGVWYAQEYGYYTELDPAGVAVTATVAGQPVPLDIADVRAIDATSAPNRWRACFRLAGPLPEGAEPFPIAAPTYGPRWFDCFDADQIGRLLEIPAEDALAIRDRALMELFYSSGLRLSELVSLDQGDVDLRDETVRVTGKGRRTR